MAQLTNIEWTDATWNPVRGCSKISPGCKHCYAERFAERFRGVKGHPFEHGFDLRLVPEKMAEPLRWITPKMIFVNSMSDLFHESVPTSYISRVVSVMRFARWHTYQVLTKRSGRLRELLSGPLRQAAEEAHIWWGVSVEDRKHGFPRIADLQAVPATVRFLSIEPLLEDLGTLQLDGIAWVIVGGESGPGARPMREEWVLSIREQCLGARIPFFFKQWGGVRKKNSGRLLQGNTHDEYPARVQHPVPPSAMRAQYARELADNLSFRAAFSREESWFTKQNRDPSLRSVAAAPSRCLGMTTQRRYLRPGCKPGPSETVRDAENAAPSSSTVAAREARAIP